MEKFFYRVGTSDTVMSLSAKFNIPPAKIIADNTLKSEIQNGDVLYIEKTDGVVYTVCPFDTFEDLEKRFGISAESIKETNKIDYLFYGLKIIIPTH